jgi:hypothetical protein
MTDQHKTKVEQNAQRVALWLMDNNTEFEQQGISEASLLAAVGLSEIDAKEAVDHLENHEEVVRMPQALTPPQFLLKPGRGWPEIKAQVLGAAC